MSNRRIKRFISFFFFVFDLNEFIEINWLRKKHNMTMNKFTPVWTCEWFASNIKKARTHMIKKANKEILLSKKNE